MTTSMPAPLVGLPVFFALLFWGVTVAVHIAFAVGVSRDAEGLRRGGTGPSLVSPFWWMAATLVGGVFVAGLYWLVHHSARRSPSRPKDAAGARPDLD